MKKIIFTKFDSLNSSLEESRPYPSINKMPEWYRSMDFFNNNQIKIIDGIPNTTIKACVPFFDSLTSGYMMPTWCDLLVDFNENGHQSINWQEGNLNPIGSHGKMQFENLSISKEYNNSVAFKWINLYHIKTPPGYSCLFSNPEFQDSPFYSLPGIVDTDTYDNIINFPFFLKNDFSGIIKCGTPIIKILPFKREDWKLEIKDNFEEDKYFADQKRSKILINYYRKNFWHPKKYK
jgi:hypothetical protein